jgi:hypothetical protein
MNRCNLISYLGASHITKQSHRTVTFLVYGSEAILPTDVMWKSPRLEMFEEGEADTARHLELDSAEETRCNVLLQLARYLQGVCRYHDRNVQRHSFNVGDMVLRRMQDDTGLHKLKLVMEGAFYLAQVYTCDALKIYLIKSCA